jgi:hypothetical protein
MPSLESAFLPFLCAERINLQLPPQARQPELRLGVSMQPPWLLLTLALTLANGSALAQQPVRPLPKLGGCPLGYYASGSTCVPSASDNTRGALEKTGSSCPLGFYGSGNYCVSSPSNDREAIQKTGNSCPLGWFSSGSYCVKSR